MLAGFRRARQGRDFVCAPTRRHGARIGSGRPARRSDAGQAAVELVAGLPALLLVAVVVMQLLAVGYTAVLAGDAAEAGALAMARGSAPGLAARRAIPGWARGGMEVRRAVGAVQVRMRPPRLLPWVGDVLRVRASAAVAAPGRTGLLP
jgi:hypothetical protein